MNVHPEFKLNGTGFSSKAQLIAFAEKIFPENPESGTGQVAAFILEWLNEADHIHVNTSGSTGAPKKIQLSKIHVKNSAQATIDYFQLGKQSEALLCMSPEYIAGKMMLVRAMVGGWNIDIVEPSRNPLENLEKCYDFSAMVPFQVYHSLQYLDKVKKLIIGGGAISSDLEQELQKKSSEAFATYGMTETISHIAVRKINGKDNSRTYHALPSVSFTLNPEGCLVINAPLISDEVIATNDIVDLFSPSEFMFLGRKDNVINSGGVKIHPEEVERKISSILDVPFFVASEKDEALGERVILIVENDEPNRERLDEISEVLSPYERPKKIYSVPQFVFTETDKIKRPAILKQLGIK